MGLDENFIYECHIDYWDEIDECQRHRKCLVWAKTYPEAMSKLAFFYGEQNIISATLAAWDTEIMEVGEDTLLTLRKENCIG